jgi:hypothetical protein
MTLDFGFPESFRWRRHDHGHGTRHASYEHHTGAWVRWCGHPTALYPYTVEFADGTALDIYGRGGLSTFRTVAEAKVAAERAIELRRAK